MLRGDDPHRYMTTSEFAEALGVSRRTVTEWCQSERVRTKPQRNRRAPYKIVRSELGRLKRELGRG